MVKRIEEEWKKSLARLEEWMNVLTHGAGLLASIAGTPLLVWRTISLRGVDSAALTGVGLFTGSMILLYAASTLYHAFQSPMVKHWFKIIDHSAIYVFIAGTYSPFMLLHLKEGSGVVVFFIVWFVVAIGVIQKLFFVYKWKILSTLLYLVLGWAPVLLATEMNRQIPAGGLLLLVLGGLAYSLGTIFYLWKNMPFHHAVWHLFVVGGTSLHYFAVFLSLKTT